MRLCELESASLLHLEGEVSKAIFVNDARRGHNTTAVPADSYSRLQQCYVVRLALHKTVENTLGPKTLTCCTHIHTHIHSHPRRHKHTETERGGGGHKV